MATWRKDRKAAQSRQTRETDEANMVITPVGLTAYHWLDGSNRHHWYTFILYCIILARHVMIGRRNNHLYCMIENNVMGGVILSVVSPLCLVLTSL